MFIAGGPWKFCDDQRMLISERIRRAIIERVGHGAVPIDDLIALVASDPSLGSSLSTRRSVESVLQRDTAFVQSGGRAFYIPALSDGVSWTVEVDADDAAAHFVRSHPSLAPITWWLVGHGADLVDPSGKVIGRVKTDGLWLDGVDTDVVQGPPGWLDAVAGGWASVTVRDETLRIAPLRRPPQPSPRQIEALRKGFAASAKPLEAELVDGRRQQLTYAVGDEPMYEAMLADREAFARHPVPHLPDLYAAAGLEERRQIIAEVGFDWEALNECQRRRRMATFYGLDERGVEALTTLVGACDLYAVEGASSFGTTDDERAEAAVLLSALLEDGNVGEGFWAETARSDRPTDEVAAFARELDDLMAGVPLVGLAWLRSRCLEEEGDVRGAAALIASVVTPDCGHLPALLDAAEFAADRGDAPGALKLLLRAGVVDEEPDDPDPDHDVRLLREIVGFATHRPKAMAGRNDPCPCGSGRKYKACHLGRERHDLADRASWLFEKAIRFAHRCDPELISGLAEQLSEDMSSLYQELSRSPFVADLALHEHGLFEEFLAERGWLLPDDERLLAAQWALVDRGVFEVVEQRRDQLRLRDIGRGEIVDVVNATLSARSGPGTTLLGRPLPVGEVHRSFGGFVAVPRSLVNPMIDAVAATDPEELIAMIASMFRPPQLRNTSSQTLSFHTLRWRIDKASAVPEALRNAGFVSADGISWSLTCDTPGMRAAIIATLRIDPDNGELVAEVNSDERATLVRERIAAALPTAPLVADEHRTLADLDEELADAPPRPSGVEESDPEFRRLMEEIIADKEVEWLDEQIPALGGRTPREAVGDPIGREEVRQLLDSWPAPPPGVVGMGFRASRIRALLGLEP